MSLALMLVALIAQGDALYPERAQAAKNIQALELYAQAIQATPENTEAHWKAARAAWWAGTRLTDRKERIRYFKKGISLGEEAIRLSPNSVEAHFWLNYASYGHNKGAFSSLKLLKSIRRELDRVNELDDRYMEGGAYRIQGILDYEVPAMFGGNKKRALERLEKSFAMNDQNPVTIFYLADYYATVGDKQKARDVSLRLNEAKPSPEFLPELPLMQEQARDLLEKL